MAASIEDVARRAGVSIATVSRALRGLPDVANSHPGPGARGGRRSRLRRLARSPPGWPAGAPRPSASSCPFVNRWFFAEVIDTVETSLRQAGFDLLLYNLGDEAGRARFFDVMPMRKRVDAVLVVSLVLADEEIAALESLGCPVGLLGLQRDGFLSTRIDDVASARMAVSHLTDLGHRRIGLIGGDTDDPMRFTPPLHRADGYHEALAAVGVEPDPALEVLGYFTIDGGEQACRTLMALPDRPTAIFAESDEMAYGALRALRRLRAAGAAGRRDHRLRRPSERRADGSVDDPAAGGRAGPRRRHPAAGRGRHRRRAPPRTTSCWRPNSSCGAAPIASRTVY